MSGRGRARMSPAAAAAAAAVATAAGAGACTSFESPNIVLDTRVIAMKASRPDQVIEVDLDRPPEPAALLDQLEPSEMCALVVDPGRERGLVWSMTLCVLDGDQLCASNASLLLASGVLPDPDTASPRPSMCATVNPDGNLLAVLLEALEDDELRGLGGIDYGVSLVVRGEDDEPALDLFAGKRMRVAPRIPDARTANANPSLVRIEATVGADVVPLPLGRCVDQPAPLTLAPRQEVRLTPIEDPAAREVYTVPRLDGDQQTFTESLTYQWLATAGSLSRGSTGGPRDAVGNPAELFTDYRAPAAAELSGPLDVSLWIVQRDERLGAEWYEACVRVVP